MTMIFRPLRLRLVGYAIVCAAIGAVVGACIVYIFLGRVPGSFWQNAPFSALGLILSVFVTPAPGTLEITDGRLEWQAAFGRRHGFDIENLDRERSKRRSRWDRMRGIQILYSVQGHKVRVNRWALGPEQTRELFDALGMTSYEAS